ncbi:MFS transporter [Amycolatopsis sp. cg5]|uniref:MFS transporter n=1 Tax=Amycolatopsis sp. cg5 TaxID=3238802 RepID=UPI0035243FC5
MADGVERPASFGSVLAVPEFRAIWLAELQSVFGDQLARVALSVLVYDRTGSAAWPALTYALTYLPDLIGGPLLSGLADRFPRKAIMVNADAGRAVLVGLMAIPGLPLWLLATLLVLTQLLNAPFTAAQAAIMPSVLSGDKYVLGQSIRQMTGQTGQLAGFALGGAVIAAIGPGKGLAVDAVTFAVSALVIRFGVRSRPAAGVNADGTKVSLLGGLVAGARTIWGDSRLRSLVMLAWLAGFVIVPEGLAVPYAAEIGGTAATAGLLLAAHPAGIVLGVFLFGRLVAPGTRQRLIGVLAVLAIVPLVGYALRPGLLPAIGLLLASGACAAYQVTAAATFMRLVPDAERGQAFGLAGSGLIAAQGVGLVVGGLLAAVLRSPALTVAVVAAVGVLVALPVAAAWRRARRTFPLLPL